jgi:hypothetical protein
MVKKGSVLPTLLLVCFGWICRRIRSPGALEDAVPVPGNARWWLKMNDRGYAGSVRSKRRPRARVSQGTAQIMWSNTQTCSISVGPGDFVYRLRRQGRSTDLPRFVNGPTDSARSDPSPCEPSVDEALDSIWHGNGSNPGSGSI